MAGIRHGSTRNAGPARPRPRPTTLNSAASALRTAAALLEKREFARAESVLREALRLHSEDPEILNELGRALWQQGRVEQAEPFFIQARSILPDDAGIWTNLGAVVWEQGRLEEAIGYYTRALELQPGLFDAMMNLGVALSDLWRLDEATEVLQAALQLRPNSADALHNMALNLGRQGRWEEALELYEKVLRLRLDHPDAHKNRAVGWLYQGDYERGWPEYEWRLKCRRHTGIVVSRPRWTGEDLKDRSILLHYEGGFGDTLQFIRFAPLVKERAACVFVLAQTALLKLVARCPGVDLAFDGTSLQPDADVHAPLMSLPAILGTTLATLPADVPYLASDSLLVAHWRSILQEALSLDAGAGRRARPFLIGVAWQGNPAHRYDRWRSFPLAQLAPLAEVPGVQLISVQAEHGLDQLHTLGGRFVVVELPSRRRRDFLDTAAIISLLDLVITPDSAVAHLAGGLGVRVWLALPPFRDDWRWMAKREDSPWYPTLRLFRQKTFGEWDELFQRMAGALREELAKSSTVGSMKDGG